MNHFPLIDASRRRGQRGAGALIAVLVLFFVVSLVAAYSSRNMIFEQKTSANQYRSTQAFEVAEAGAEWAIAMLNGGGVDNTCLPSNTAPTFRNRYLTINATTGAITPNLLSDGVTPFNVMCVRTLSAWSCSCPVTGTEVLSAPTVLAPAPAFRLTFFPATAYGRPGVVYLRSQGCTRLDSSCLNDAEAAQGSGGGDATATIRVLLALKGAIAAPPGAALTAGTSAAGTPGSVNTASGAAIQVTNTEPQVNGITVDAAGVINQLPMFLSTVSGSPGANSVVQGDSTLPSTSDLLFASMFGMNRSTYMQQPAAIVLDCSVDDCSAVALSNLASWNPGRIIWLNMSGVSSGDLNLNSGVNIGTSAAPTVLVVNGGNLKATAAATINGLVYVVPNVATGTWTTAGSPIVNGAVVVEGSVDGTGTPNLTYNLPILNSLRLNSGSFVRVPGGWKDY